MASVKLDQAQPTTDDDPGKKRNNQRKGVQAD
jgi:hypothetical protein